MIRKNLIVNSYYDYEYPSIVEKRLYFCSPMKQYCGKVGEIISVDETVDLYRLLINGADCGWYFNNAMLCPSNSLSNIIAHRKERRQ